MVVAVASTVFLCAGLIIRHWQRQSSAIPNSTASAPANLQSVAQPAILRASGRPVYPLSVIRGGAYSPGELIAALESDSVAAQHYQVFQRARLRTEKSPFTGPVYVSYRRYNHIFWTRRALSLHAGETLLTDGVSYARARCGNRISLSPQQPVAELEPLADTLDTPELVGESPELLKAAVELEPAVKPFIIGPEDFASPTFKALETADPPVPTFLYENKLGVLPAIVTSSTHGPPLVAVDSTVGNFFTGPYAFQAGLPTPVSFEFAPHPATPIILTTYSFASTAFASNPILFRTPVLEFKPIDFQIVNNPLKSGPPDNTETDTPSSPSIPEPSTLLLLSCL